MHPAELIQPALMGLADLEVEVIATSGRRGRTEVGVTPPANARVVDLIDFASVLPRAAVFVTNAGWGGVLASLAAGVPSWSAAGPPPISRRSPLGSPAAASASTSGRAERSPKAVAAAVREVLANPKYRERARQIGSELDQLGGAGAAVDLLERLAETRAPIPSRSSPK